MAYFTRAILNKVWEVQGLLLIFMLIKHCQETSKTVKAAALVEIHENTLDCKHILPHKEINDQSGVHGFQSAAMIRSRAVSRAVCKMW